MGPVTKRLCISLLACTLVFSVTQRSYGFSIEDLMFTVGHVLEGDLWRLTTFPLIERVPIGLLISLLILWFLTPHPPRLYCAQRHAHAEWDETLPSTEECGQRIMKQCLATGRDAEVQRGGLATY